MHDWLAQCVGGSLDGRVIRTSSETMPCVQQRDGHHWIATYRPDGTTTPEGYRVYRLGDDEGPGERPAMGDGKLGRMLMGERS